MTHRPVWILTVLTAICLLAPVSPAQQPETVPLDPNADRLAQLNRLVRVPGSVTDITDGLMGALAGMDEPPTPLFDFFLTDRSSVWASYLRWTKASPQQDAIDAVIGLTEGEGPFQLGLPYGETEWSENGLGVLIGEGQPLVELNSTYIGAVLRLQLAMSVEMWDKAEAGEAERVSAVAIAWVRLSRIVLDRELSDEKLFGYSMMEQSLGRLRDVIYTHPDLFSEAQYLALIEALDNDELELDRVRLPRGNRLVALDLVERTMEPERGVDPTKFGLVMASSLTPEDRPLELFSITAQMNKAGVTHAGWFETYDEINKVFGDWWTRWETPDFHDFSLNRPSDFEKMSLASFQIVNQTMGDIDILFDLRMIALTELFGTRNALGVMAFRARNNQYPPNISAVSPQFVEELDVDPMSVHPRFLRGSEQSVARTRYEKSVKFKYLVPIRDQRWGPREEKTPYEIRVTSGFGDSGSSEPSDEPAEATDANDVDPQTVLSEIPSRDWDEWMRKRKEISNRFIQTPGMTEQTMIQSAELAFRPLANLSEQQQTSALLALDEATRQQMLAVGLIKLEDITPLDLRLVDETTVTSSNYVEIYGAVSRKHASVPGQIAWYLEALNKPDVTIDSLIEVDRRVMEQALIRRAQGLDKAVPSSIGQTEFTVKFDDSVFLLYSVGEDYQDDAARLVGPGGTDYLIWPPLPSIRRDGGTVN